jgi:hypothetical protein
MQLPYLFAVIEEGLRINGPAPYVIPLIRPGAEKSGLVRSCWYCTPHFNLDYPART